MWPIVSNKKSFFFQIDIPCFPPPQLTRSDRGIGTLLTVRNLTPGTQAELIITLLRKYGIVRKEFVGASHC